MFDTFGDTWNGAYYSIYNSDEELIMAGDLDSAQEGDGVSFGANSLCLANGDYTISVGGGTFDMEVEWALQCLGGETVSGGAPVENMPFSVFDTECLVGCMDAEADNYNPDATYSAGCQYIGCTAPAADNYNGTANVDDGSCVFLFDGYVFFDANTNGVFDTFLDYGLANQAVTLNPGGVTVYTNNEGYFSFGELPAGDYSISVAPNSEFGTFTTPSSYDFTANELDSNNFYFGMTNEDAIQNIDVAASFWGNGYPCNGNPAFHFVSLTNTGNVPLSGTIQVDWDPLFEGIETYNNDPDSVIGTLAYFSFTDVLPTQSVDFSFYLTTPSVDFMGEILTTVISAFAYEGDVLVAFGEDVEEHEVTCAWDPNDKTVTPGGYSDEHFVLNGTNLEYRVRFQNLGNAAATDVLIRDTLDVSLDLSTFQLHTATHDIITTLDPVTREVTFLFSNILLPDSASDPEGSMGLFTYSIDPVADLAFGTVIVNTAHIFFDSNPAVVTNTTWNTIFECGIMFPTEDFVDNIICLGNELNGNNTIPYAEDFFWTIDGEVVASNEDLNWLAEVSDNFEVAIHASNPLCEVEYMIDVFVAPTPNAEITQDGSILTASSGTSYQWYLNNEVIYAANGQTIEVTDSGSYTVEVNNEFGCSDMSDAVTVVSVAYAEEDAFSFYPNPVNDVAQLQFQDASSRIVQVISMTGQIVMDVVCTQNTLTIDAQSFALGTYTLRIVHETKGIQALRFVVE